MKKLASILIMCILTFAMFAGCRENSQNSDVVSETEVTEAVTKAETTESATVELETTEAVTKQKTQASKTNRGQKNIIPYIYLGMSVDEVVSRTGVDFDPDEKNNLYGEIDGYVLTYSGEEADIFNMNPYIQALNPNMEYCLNFDFSNNDILWGYSCQIGAKKNNDFSISYPYGEAELTEMYEQIYDILCDWYGEAEKGSMVGQVPGVIAEYLWYDTEFGNINFWYGVDMWVEDSGINSIYLCCDDEVLKTSSESEYYNKHMSAEKTVSNGNNNNSDGIIGDNDGDGDIDEDDWKTEWENYLNNAMGEDSYDGVVGDNNNDGDIDEDDWETEWENYLNNAMGEDPYDGVVGDNNNDGDIDENDWETEWDNYLDNVLKGY